MKIRDIAREDVVTALPDASVQDLAELMRDKNVGSVVITEEETPVGIVTDRDITIDVVAGEQDARERIARDVMSERVIFAGPDQDVFDVVKDTADQTVRRIPVVEDGKLVGIVTFDDLYLHYVTALQKLGGVVFRESHVTE